MPRSTSGGGFHSSGSSHRSSSSSHGSSHRSSGSRGSSFHSSSSSGHSPRGSYHGRPSYGTFIPYRGTGTGRPLAYRGASPGSIIASVVFLILAFAAIGVFLSGTGGSGGIPASTAARTKLDLGYAFESDCIVDEIGWIDNESRLSKDLQEFYKKTGCQPFVYMKAYDPECSTDAQLARWAAEYYDANFADSQHVVFYAYACETPDPNDDSGNGWQNVQLGTQSSLVMDAEALDIFWAYVDADWNTWDPNDNDGMFADIFTRTAGRIMQKTTTGLDVIRIAIIAVLVIGAGICVIVIMKLRRRHAREEAAETAAILNAPLGQTAAQTEAQNLADRYNDTGPDGTVS